MTGLGTGYSGFRNRCSNFVPSGAPSWYFLDARHTIRTMEQSPKEPSQEKINADIERLLKELDNYVELKNKVGPKLREEWYWTEMEARLTEGQQTTKTRLEELLGELKVFKEKV